MGDPGESEITRPTPIEQAELPQRLRWFDGELMIALPADGGRRAVRGDPSLTRVIPFRRAS